MQIQFDIPPVSSDIEVDIQQKIDLKTKPLGALGLLEKLALQISNIQSSTSPELHNPTMVVFAGDHGIAKDGVSAYPQEVTFQMVMNFLNDGAAISVFCRQHDIDLKVVDAGVNYDFCDVPGLMNAKIGFGTKSYLNEPAMSLDEMERAIEKGATICERISKDGSNIIGFGEMGIGNTSSSSLIMSKICGFPVVDCVGRGTGLDDQQLTKKVDILERAAELHDVKSPLDALRTFGGFEMAMMCGAMLKAAEQKMVIMIDGFIATSVFLVAHEICPELLDYAIFTHQSDEQGHGKLLNYLKVSPILDMNLRLGEGTGCALSYPLINSSILFLNEMASFESAGVSQKE